MIGHLCIEMKIRTALGIARAFLNVQARELVSRQKDTDMQAELETNRDQ